MAKIVESFDFGDRREKYDWDTLLDGQIRVLTRGEDFDVQAHSMRTGAWQAAKCRGMKVNVRVVDDSTVVIQAVRPDDRNGASQ